MSMSQEAKKLLSVSHAHQPKSSVPVIGDAFRILEASPMTMKDAAAKMKLNDMTLRHWKHGRSTPDVAAFEAFANMLGFRIVLRPLEKPRVGPSQNP